MEVVTTIMGFVEHNVNPISTNFGPTRLGMQFPHNSRYARSSLQVQCKPFFLTTSLASDLTHTCRPTLGKSALPMRKSLFQCIDFS